MPIGQMDNVVRYIRQIAAPGAREQSDAHLLDCFLTHQDEGAFAKLVTRHGPLVLSVCRRVLKNQHDAEDAFQATFLVLVRKAASIGRKELLANWLYGVAYRTAMKSRTTLNRKRAKEKQLADRAQPNAPPDDIPDELLMLLDRELTRLPDKYRLPVLCCDLQGMSRAAAAGRLGWPIGTLNWRLAKARQLLAKALTGHGLTLSGGTVALALSQQVVRAAVSPGLVQITVKAGKLMLTTGCMNACTVSAKVVSLTEGIVKSMFLTKLKTAMLSLVAIAVVGGASGLASNGAFTSSPTGSADEGKPASKPVEQPAKKERGVGMARNNFLVIAPSASIAKAIGDAAEEYRQKLAIEWFGVEPPRWSKQCVITVSTDRRDPSGATSFNIQDGEIGSVKMELQGPLERLLESSLPHEITHVLFTHHFGSPIPRWADEGAAILSSDETERTIHENAFQQIRKAPHRFIPLDRLFTIIDYGKDPAALHAEGFSITKFLVESDNRAIFVDFLTDGMRHGWENAVRHHYGYESLAKLEKAWLKTIAAHKPSSSISGEAAPSSAVPDTPKQNPQPAESTKTTKLGGDRLFKALGSYDGAGNLLNWYTFSFRLVRVGLKGKNTFKTVLKFKNGTEVRLVQTNGMWELEREKKLDTSNATAVLEFKLTVPSKDNPQLELTVQDNDIRRADQDNKLTVSSHIHAVRNVVLGRESQLTLVENDNGVPKRWLEFTLDETTEK